MIFRFLTLVALLLSASAFSQSGPIVCEDWADECDSDGLPNNRPIVYYPPPEPITAHSAVEWCSDQGCVIGDLNPADNVLTICTTNRDVFMDILMSEFRSLMPFSLRTAVISQNEYNIRRTLREDEIQKQLDKLKAGGYQPIDVIGCVLEGAACSGAIKNIKRPWHVPMAALVCLNSLVKCRQLDLAQKDRLRQIEALNRELQGIIAEKEYNSWEPTDLPQIRGDAFPDFVTFGIKCVATETCINEHYYCKKVVICQGQ